MLVLQRFLQKCAALAWIVTLLVGGLLGFFIWAYLVYASPLLRIPLVLYAVWIVLDLEPGLHGQKRSEWVRNWRWWSYLRDYYPCELHKTAELPADDNYLIAAFPHGLLASGPFSAFCTNACRFTDLYPGITVSVASLYRHYITPFIRELVIRLGNIPVAEKCLVHVLTQQGKGKAVVVMAGGAREAFYCKPNMNKVYLNKRKGFVRLALMTGASLVPVYTFGETDLYDQVERGLLHRVQQYLKRITGIAFVLISGFSLIPRRHPLHVVVGEPIKVEQTNTPTPEQIDMLHLKFVSSLKELFDTHKVKFVANPNQVQLIIV